jgi:tetratricopeptide (TPR) repeat protein
MNLPLSMRLANAVLSYARYLGKTVFPSGLAAFYPYPGVVRGTTFPWTHAVVAGVVIVAITVVAVLMWKRERAVLVGWLWFLGVLVPSIGIVQVGLQSMADRYTYLPHLGLFIAIVWGVGTLVERSVGLRQASAIFAGVVTLVLAGCTAYQLRYWENGYTLFTHALEVTENNSAAHMGLAIWLTTNGRGEEALPHYRETLRLQPNIADAQNNIGNFYRERGDLEAALKHLRMAVEINSKYPEGYHNLANVLGDLGRIDEAERAYRRAIELEPDAAQFHYNLGLLLASVGRFEKAAVEFEAALKIRPGDVDARFMYALALLEAGQRDAAKVQLEQVLSARPEWTDAMGRFAWVLATSETESSRDPKAALELAFHANKLSGFGQSRLLDTLAAAYAASGLFDQAVQAATRARDLALAREQKEFAQRVDERLKLYQAGKAFHVPPTTQMSPASAPSPGTPGEGGGEGSRG